MRRRASKSTATNRCSSSPDPRATRRPFEARGPSATGFALFPRRPTNRDRWKSSSGPIAPDSRTIVAKRGDRTGSRLRSCNGQRRSHSLPSDWYPLKDGPHRRLPPQDLHDELPAKSEQRRDNHRSPEACKRFRRTAVSCGTPPPNGMNACRCADIGRRSRRNAHAEREKRHRNDEHSIRSTCKRVDGRRGADASSATNEEAVARRRASAKRAAARFSRSKRKSPAALGPRGSVREVLWKISS